MAVGQLTILTLVITTSGHENGLPSNWLHPTKTTVNVTMFMRHDASKLEELKTIFWEVSDPYHPKRGQYLSAVQAREYVRPTLEAASAVRRWQDAHGISHRRRTVVAGSIWQLELTLTEATRALTTTCSLGAGVTNMSTGHHVVRCPDPKHPHIDEHILQIVVGGLIPVETLRQHRLEEEKRLGIVSDFKTQTRQRRQSAQPCTYAYSECPCSAYCCGCPSNVAASCNTCGTYTSSQAEAWNAQHAPPCAAGLTRVGLSDVSFGTCGVSTTTTIGPSVRPSTSTCADLLNSSGWTATYLPPPIASGISVAGQTVQGTTYPMTSNAIAFPITFASYSGFVGHNFDPRSIPRLGNPACMFPVPVDMSAFTSWRGTCPLNPFLLDMPLSNLTTVVVYLNSTTGGGNHTFPFAWQDQQGQSCQASITNQLQTRQNLCGIDKSTVPPTYIDDVDFKVPLSPCLFISSDSALSEFWEDAYYLTVEFQFLGGYSIVETTSMFYPQSTPPRVEPYQYLATRPKLPSQLLVPYQASELPNVRSGQALTGTRPAVVEPEAWFPTNQVQGMVNWNDFAQLVQASNAAGVAPLPDGAMHGTFISLPVVTGNTSTIANAVPYSALDPSFDGQPSMIANDQSQPGDEASLDIQWIAGVSRASNSYVYHGGYWTQVVLEYLATQYDGFTDDTVEEVVAEQVGGSLVETMLLLDIVLAAMYGETQPDILSMSFGTAATSASTEWMSHVEAYFPALGAMGVSLIAASGDRGAHYPWANTFVGTLSTGIRPPYDCEATIVPSFPASSPYVTAVGATQFVRSRNQENNCSMRWPPASAAGAAGPCVEEIVCSIATSSAITTGGGFGVGDRPDYQKTVVDAYVASHMSLAHRLNSENRVRMMLNRGYPDVSANGHECEIVLNGAFEGVDGTSCAAPAFAGLIAIINDHLRSVGKPRLGFLNPTLYAAPSSVWSDVVRGNNNCSGQGQLFTACCDTGFSADSGWDPATGLGTLKVKPFLDWYTTPAPTAVNLGIPSAPAANSKSSSAGKTIGFIVLALVVVGGVVGAAFFFSSRRTPRHRAIPNPTYQYAASGPTHNVELQQGLLNEP